MGKQAIGIYASNFRHRFDTMVHVLSYPQRPMVSTHTARILNCDRLPCGINAIVAIACFTGFNQEDSVIVNRSAVDRGLFVSTYYRTFREQNNKNHSTGEEEFFCRPDPATTRNMKPHNYGKIGQSGFAEDNAYVEPGDVIIGKCMPQKQGHMINNKDTSVALKSNERGFVDRNCYGHRHFTNVTGDGYTFAKVSCYTVDHEVLTLSDGWVPIAEVRAAGNPLGAHRVACVGDDGGIRYLQPSAVQKYTYSGVLVEVRGPGVDLLVTPEHRLWASTSVEWDTAGDAKSQAVFAEMLAGDALKRVQVRCLKGCPGGPNKSATIMPCELRALRNIGRWMNEALAAYCAADVAADADRRAPPKLPAWVWRMDADRALWIAAGLLLPEVSLPALPSVVGTRLAEEVQRLCMHVGMRLELVAHRGRCAYYTMAADGVEPVAVVARAATLASSQSVFCCTMPVGPGVIYVRRAGIPGTEVWCGNSRHGQKGTIGMLYREEDMPFTSSGIVPSMIINPHAIPSRMTIGQLMEALESKAGAFSGALGDATPFNGRTVEDIAKELEAHGAQRYGDEVMYNPRSGEQVPCAVFICPTYYQRLKHMVEDKVHCLTADHDVLTAEGWKPIAEVTLDDRVATLDADGLRLTYQSPEAVMAFPAVGRDMVRVRGKHVDLEVTADHRMFVRVSDEDAYVLTPASELIACDTKPASYKRDALLSADEEGANAELRSDEWLVRFARCIAEAHLHAIAASDAATAIPKGDSRLDEIARWTLEAELELFMAYRRLPRWVFSLGQKRAAIMLTAMLRVDPMRRTVRTTCRRIADDVQHLALHAGASATVEQDDDDEEGCWRAVVDEDANEPTAEATEAFRFDGPVYCLTVPGPRGVFYVRRNGKPCWTGNSRGANGPVVLLTRQPAEGRARDGGLRLGEMELECLWAHGSMYFLKERFMECSDNYRVFVCNKCGMMATVNPERGIYFCKACKNITEFAEFRIPYASKLLLQEIETMSIGARFDAEGRQRLMRQVQKQQQEQQLLLQGRRPLLALPAPPV